MADADFTASAVSLINTIENADLTPDETSDLAIVINMASNQKLSVDRIISTAKQIQSGELTRAAAISSLAADCMEAVHA